MVFKSASFTDIADALKFGKKHSGAVTPPALTLSLPRAKSSVSLYPETSLELHHTANIRSRKNASGHFPTPILKRILSYCDTPTLRACLTVSRLIFHLAGHLLYSEIELHPKSMQDVLRGSVIVHEAATGMVTGGRKRFKDRLLKRVSEVTVWSHGEDDDDDEPSPPCCPPVTLNYLLPKLDSLRIVLGEAFDYHMTFCPRYPPTCPMFRDLVVEKLVILGARSPMPVLPLAFPHKYYNTPTTPTTPGSVGTGSSVGTTSPNTPLIAVTEGEGEDDHLANDPLLLVPNANPSNVSALYRASANSFLPANSFFPPTGKHHTRTASLAPPAQVLPKIKNGHTRNTSLPKSLSSLPLPSPPATNTTHSPRLPPCQELTIVMPTGLSYDAKDYQPYSHCFRHRKTLLTLERFVLVFYSPPKLGRPWQIAFYNARKDGSSTSYVSLVDDVAGTCLAVPFRTEIEIVGTETMDGELLNMGLNTMRTGKVGKVMQDRLRSRIETKWYAEGMKGDVKDRLRRVRFRTLGEWLEGEGEGVVEGWDLEKWGELGGADYGEGSSDDSEEY
ncbi:hypothetical protein L198_05225 [Cryptococcus wingfieldii CBS 7118]|uniref:F-box domain-containing protein n=1 Tax=Cryptococcus wingfieldii CBS 7118 TaxID=1295528 RepID=A0A1E3J2M3_9TREE|nr:hypothetical protein L198_05225 [Cryptococcus wingfieldii CBS 7118]ODN94366.1 hypothetical protein L198_05225 [Cryptococcus wingfieldii CBS 7118]